MMPPLLPREAARPLARYVTVWHGRKVAFGIPGFGFYDSERVVEEVAYSNRTGHFSLPLPSGPSVIRRSFPQGFVRPLANW